MIRVSKIAHASYETPDLDQQTEYYTEILGLTLAAKEKDAVFLASTVDHHSVVLRKGPQAQCMRVGFQIAPDADLGEFEKQVASHGIKTERRKDPEPSISDMLVFADPKGTVMEVFKRDAFSHQKFQPKGIVPFKLGHVAFHVTDVKHVTKFYCRRARLSRIRLDGRLLLVPALRARPPHHQPDADRLEPALPHRLRAARLGPHADGLRFPVSINGYKLLWGPGRHGIGHNLFAYHRAPNGLITETFAELDRMNEELGYFEPRPWHRDNPQRPKVWAKDPSASNLWGIMPTDEMHH